MRERHLRPPRLLPVPLGERRVPGVRRLGFCLNGENVARVPDSDADQDFVSINSVNHESNARYFNRNDHVEIQHALPGAKSRLVIGGVRARKCARARDATPSLRGPVSPVRTSVRARSPPRLPPDGG